MPRLEGQKLDEAYSRLKAIGLEDRDNIDIEGGGVFGPVIKSNWTVCTQTPKPGSVIAKKVRLVIKRSCSPQTNSTPTRTPPTATETSPPADRTSQEVLTPERDQAFASLLMGDDCSVQNKRFAAAHENQRARFDGSIVALSPHGNFKTRFDYLVSAGDFDPDSVSGPAFQIKDKNAFDLNLTGSDIPDSIRVGQNYTFTVDLREYDPQTCIYQVDPVEAKVR